MKKLWKLLFSTQKVHNIIDNYIDERNLTFVFQYFCDAKIEEMTKYDFWNTYNGLYHDIIPIYKLDSNLVK